MFVFKSHFFVGGLLAEVLLLLLHLRICIKLYIKSKCKMENIAFITKTKFSHLGGTEVEYISPVVILK